MSSYNRMLIHRVAAWFGMEHNVDGALQCVIVGTTKTTRIPEVEQSDYIAWWQLWSFHIALYSIDSFQEPPKRHFHRRTIIAEEYPET